MLVLTLRVNDKVLIGKEISVMLVKINGGQVRLGFEAPAEIKVMRENLELRDNEQVVERKENNLPKV